MATAASTVRPPASVESRSQAVKFRRGLTLLAMSLVVPGSAQIAAGQRRVGRIGMRMWFGLLALGVVTVALVLLARGVLVTIITTGWVLWLGSFVLLAVGVVWVALLLHTWLLARPRSMGGTRGVVFTAIAAMLAAALSLGTWTAAAAMRSSGSLVSSVFAGGGDAEAKAGRINVLLIGSDAGNDREGVRTDSLMVASVDAKTGRAILFGIPRNLEDVPFPDYSPLQKLYPKGYGCPTHECLINAVYQLGEQHRGLYPNAKNPGIQATKEAVEGVTGLKLNYYVLVDMAGFISLVDAVGGIRIDLNKRTPIAGEKGYDWVEPKKDLLMNGDLALQIARSRYQSSDYERMVRQRCVISAMLNQLDPVTVATKFTDLASATQKGLSTDVPSSEINRLAELALKTRQLEVTSVSFTPPVIFPGTPNYPLIKQLVKGAIAESEALDKPAPSSAAPASSAAPTRPAATGKPAASAPATGRSSDKPASAAATPTGEGAEAPADPSAICVAR